MKPEKINELIPVIHAEEKRRGKWDGLPSLGCIECALKIGHYDGIPDCTFFYGDDHGHMCCKIGEASLNSFLATKLDFITEALVDAMRAKREGRRCDALACVAAIGQRMSFHNGRGSIRTSSATFSDVMIGLVLNTYEHHLTLALYRVLDLMGFYGVEYSDQHGLYDDLEEMDSTESMRAAIYACARDNYMIERHTKGTLRSISACILRIAELDNIDLEWHLDALRKYQGGE